MGVGIEDVLAVKALETGVVPPVPNFRDVDPELGQLNLSNGGAYPIRYALRLAAGFGSQISMILLRWTPPADGRRRHVDELGYGYRIADRPTWTAWLKRVSGQDDPRAGGRRAARSAWSTACPPRRPRPPAPVAEAVVPPRRPSRRRSPAVVRARAGRRGARAGRRAPTGSTPGAGGDRGRADGLPAGSAGHGSGSGGGSGDRHGASRPRCSRRSVRRTGSSATTRSKLRDYPTLNAVVGFVHEPVGPPRRGRPSPRRAGRRRLPAPRRCRRRRWSARVLAIVAEQTGYPPDLLDMDLDLEADLGIDTVKQAEVFATIREAYGIERDDSLKLRDYPTLNAVVGFVRERTPQAAPRRRAGGRAGARAGAGGRRSRCAAADGVEATGAGDRGGADGLPAGPAGHGSGPGGRPRDRHGQAGGGVRDDPRGVRDRARRLAQAARLPDPEPRSSASCASGRRRPRRRRPSRSSPRRAGARGAGAAAAGDGVEAQGAGDRGRADGLPGGPAGHGPGSGGGPRDRHGQAGGGVRDDPRGVRDRARRLAQAARLPDPDRGRRLRARADAAGGAAPEPARRTRARPSRAVAAPEPPPTSRAASPCPSCGRRSTRCAETGVRLGEGTRVLVVPDSGGVADRARPSDSRSSASRS